MCLDEKEKTERKNAVEKENGREERVREREENGGTRWRGCTESYGYR